MQQKKKKIKIQPLTGKIQFSWLSKQWNGVIRGCCWYKKLICRIFDVLLYILLYDVKFVVYNNEAIFRFYIIYTHTYYMYKKSNYPTFDSVFRIDLICFSLRQNTGFPDTIYVYYDICLCVETDLLLVCPKFFFYFSNKKTHRFSLLFLCYQ